MAIVQISKIQQRAGNLVDLPQLDNAEFGWATDENRLFIGRTGNSYSDENIEVLTSYSNISFSQIDGSDGGNFNVTSAINGQILAYVSSTDTWENYTGLNSQFDGGKLQLGNVANISMTGGAIGYVLQTDGLGNLSWVPKSTLYTPIINLTNNVTGNIITMTVANTTPYTNGQSVTISNANITNSSANSNINGKSFYVKLNGDYANSGDVVLYTDISLTITANGAGLLTYGANSGVATASLGGTGSGAVGGSNTTVQFNDQNISNGVTSFTFNKSTTTLTVLSGNVISANINATTAVTGPILVSNVSTGTAPLTVTSTTLVPNLFVARANVSEYANTALTNTGIWYPLFASATSGNLAQGANANLSFNAATGNLTTTLLNVTGNASTGNLGTTTLVATTGNITTINSGLMQNNTSNITIASAGNVSTFIGGNATAQFVVTATGANIPGTANVVGNANVGNLGTTTLVATTGNITTINSGLMKNSTSNITIASAGNVSTFIGGNATSQLTVTATGANIPGTANVVGNANVGNLGTAQVFASANITTPQFISNVATGTAPLSVQSTTRVANLNVDQSNIANYANVVTNTSGTWYPTFVNGSTTANYQLGSNSNLSFNAATGALSATLFTGTLTTAAQPNITSVGNLTTLTVSGRSNLNAVGNVYISGGTANQILKTDGSGNLSWADPTGGYYLHTQTSANTTWTVVHNLNRQYVSVEPIDSNGNSYVGRYDFPIINYANANALIITFSSAVAGWAAVVGGGLNLGNLSANYSPAGVNTQVQFNDAGVMAGSSGLVYNKTTGTLSATLFAGSGANLSNIAGANVTGTVASATTAGTVTTAAQGNITSVGTLTSLGVNGTVTAVAFTANTGVFTGNGNGLSSIVGANVTGTVANATYATSAGNATSAGSSNTAGTVTTNAQPNITSTGTLTSLAVTGNVSAANFVGTGGGLPIITSSGSLSISATSGVTINNILTLSTGSNVTAGTITGNWTLTTGSRLEATSATSAGTVTTNAQPNITSVGTLSLLAVTGNITNGNVTGGNLVSASYLAGTLTTAAQPNITSVGTLSSLAVTGNANINTGTPVAFDTTGSIITGRILGRYANRTGNTTNYYFADYNGSNNISTPDALAVSKLGTILDTNIGNSNISMAIGTSYGNKAAGLAFVSGTSSDALAISLNAAPSYTGNINAVMLGYPTVGPRILVQDYALSDDSPNVITYIGTTHVFVGNVTASNLTLANNSAISMGSNTNVGTFTGNFSLSAGSRLNATYADLAEYYEADSEYEAGTVLEFGGQKEVTLAEALTPRVAGVVSTNPAYVMNSTCKGEHIVAIALQGRVPCKVRGPIRKGDMLVSAGGGFARPSTIPLMGTVIGKALENFDGIEGIIEIAVGRL